MTLKNKLTFGLGFLFLIIFVLVIFYSYHLGTLSQDAENILKDNYKSLVYAKDMISALEDMRTAVTAGVFSPAENKTASDYNLNLFEARRTQFLDNLKSENGNITEIHESEYVATANEASALYTALGLRIVKGEGGRDLYFSEFQPAFEKLKQAISNINDVNMQAVERKSQTARSDSARIIRLMAAVGVFCLILAFGYFWYFPVYISNSVAYLAEKMKALLKKSGIVLDIQTDDEAFILLQGINLLENKVDQERGKKASDVKA
jgi:Ca2+/Na+ antiporter